MADKEQTLREIERLRDELNELCDEETHRRIRLVTQRRNQMILQALNDGASERETCAAAGITRGLIWKLKQRVL